MTRWWGGGPDGGTRVVITAFSASGAPIRQIRAEILDDVPIRVELPAGTVAITLQRTTEETRVRVDLGEHRPARQQRRRRGGPR